MLNIPLNHKTVFLFDHANYFAASCGQTTEFDMPTKAKPTTSSQHTNLQKLNPLNKSLWTSIVESAFEFVRIVYDIFPENKLIRLVVSKRDKLEFPLNQWNETDQGLDHVTYFLNFFKIETSQFIFEFKKANELNGPNHASIAT